MEAVEEILIEDIVVSSSVLTAVINPLIKSWVPSPNDTVGLALKPTGSNNAALVAKGRITFANFKWTVAVQMDEASPVTSNDVYNIVYMDKDKRIIGQSADITLNDTISSSSPQSLDSFIAISDDDEKGYDSYTIIDRNAVLLNDEGESIISEDWDMTTTTTTAKVNLIPVKGVDKNEHSNLSTQSNSYENEIIKQVKKTPHNISIIEQKPTTSTGFEVVNSSTSTCSKQQKEITESTSTMTQSVIITEEDHISQSRARQLQKHNKDLLNKVKKLSGWLTECKQELEMKNEHVTSKDESISSLKKKLHDTTEELNALKFEASLREKETTKQIENLTKIIKIKDEQAASRQEEFEYLTRELEKVQVKLKSTLKELKHSQNEAASLKRGERKKNEMVTPPIQPIQFQSSKPRDRHNETGDVEIRRAIQKQDHHYRKIQQQSRRSPPLPEPPEVRPTQPPKEALESLKKESAVAVCPVCGKVRPPHEDAMAMTVHMEKCLRKKGFT
jgi:myosin heavy subunit